MERTTVIIVDAPEIAQTETKGADETFLGFYRALGWNGEDLLDPCKVRTTKEVYNRLFDAVFEKCPDAIAVGMLMANNGPGTDDRVPPGKVVLLEGWIKPADADGREIIKWVI